MAVAICFTIISGHGSLQHVTNIAGLQDPKLRLGSHLVPKYGAASREYL